MKIIKKAVTSRTRSPMMANHQAVNVKIFLSYPKRTKRRRRKRFIPEAPNRYSLSYPQTQAGTEQAAGSIPNGNDPYNMENLLDNTDPFLSSTSTTPSSTATSTPSSSTTWQPADTETGGGNTGWGNLLSDFDDETRALGTTSAEDPLLTQSQKKTKTKNRRLQPLELSGAVDQTSIPMSTSLPTSFHSEEQLGIPLMESAFPIMQQDISSIKECSYYVLFHNQGVEHGNWIIRLEISPDGKNFVIQEEKGLYPEQMLVLSPRHVARFTRLYITCETKGKKSGLEEVISLSSAQLDIYFQYKTASSSS